MGNPLTHRRRLLALGAGAALSGCAMPVRMAAVPSGQALKASVLGLPNERFFPTLGVGPLEREVMAVLAHGQEFRGAAPGARTQPLNLLAVSGGGENGAFGAGLLMGWSEQGSRPVFDLVTGVSTGALTAPFAFLGPAYDGALREVYTNITAADVLRQRWLPSAIWDDALADNTPLLGTIGRYLNETMLAEIARGYREGRLLLIGTTNLDAQLPVIWNIGAIADSGHPGAAELIRRILLASAAIPGAFSPVMIDVTLDGVRHQEMHVDGGAVAQAFLYPQALTRDRRQRIARRQPVLPITAYVIRNARLDPEWTSVDRRTMGIAGRAISTMIATSGLNDVLRIYNTTQMDRVGFQLAFIGPEFDGVLTSPFEQSYMRALYAYGLARGRTGQAAWVSAPPFLSAEPGAAR
ncbi:patatin [Falsiroseomonas bella]|uniref:Patatin n=1 Tax=Falsiroseomonas bella TaxID=2184016 RepID=A0A317FCI9_9PROT|nr:patatin-like phospholipase family protein [Falsiroseomonas bella]PWS35727.1 patatin [Falsiroseomonas bella]